VNNSSLLSSTSTQVDVSFIFHLIQDKHMAALVSERFSSSGKLKV